MRRLALLLALPLAACVPSDEGEQVESPQDLPSLARDQGNPQLALADHLLAEYFAAQGGPQSTVCLAASDGREPVALAPEDERALMMRHVRLSPMASCRQDDGAWVGEDSGDEAMVFALQQVSCTHADHCTGFASYVAGAQQGPVSRYEMAWDDGAWSFTRDEPLGPAQ